MRALFLCFPLVVVACGGDTSATDAGPDGSNNGNDGSMMTADSGGDGSMMNADSGGDGSMMGGDGGGGDGGALKITCGPSLTCMASDTCCVSQGGQPMYTCMNGMCPMGQTALKCAKTSDCAMGNVCCAHIDPMNNVTSQCLQACPNTNNDAQLCSNMDMPTGCPMNVMCSSTNIGDWNLPMGFATCGGKGN